MITKDKKTKLSTRTMYNHSKTISTMYKAQAFSCNSIDRRDLLILSPCRNVNRGGFVVRFHFSACLGRSAAVVSLSFGLS